MLVATRLVAPVLAAAVFATGCAAGDDALDPAQARLVAPDPGGALVAPSMAASAGQPARGQHAAAGFVAVSGSPILPWCTAVLIAPDVAVTAADCVQGVLEPDLRFGVGPTDAGSSDEDAPGVAVLEVLLHPRAHEAAHALAALRLAKAVDGVEPVMLAEASPAGCGYAAVSHRHHVQGEDGRRWIWRGCLEATLETTPEATADGAAAPTLWADAGRPNCHGDVGSGIFAADGGETIVGVATAVPTELGEAPHDDSEREAGPEPAHTGCVDAVSIATVAANLQFFEGALTQSALPI